MAIPPIIANNPLLKLFRTDNSGTDNTANETRAPATDSDVVELSNTARQRLDGIESLSASDPDRIRAVADESRGLLEANKQLILGLDRNAS